MSWFKHLRGGALCAMLVASAGMLGACSFQPVYSSALAASPSLALAYGKPNSRLEQIVYQELALRLGESEAATAPLATVSVSSGGSGVAFMTANPAVTEQQRVSVTATLTITQRNGGSTPPLVLTRTATAQYTTSNQVLANTEAATEATERAAKAAAESLRLAVLASLSR